jgi:glyoxylase-like metal-dependent hydrolase (beta-lactamase superfamily II)
MTSTKTAGPHQFGKWIFNCWVFENGGSGRPFVVDLGLPSSAERLLAAFGSGATDPKRAPVIAATHLHVDHVAGVPCFERVAPCTVCLPAQGAAYAEGASFELPGLREVVKALPAFRKQGFSMASLLELRTAKVGTVRSGYVSPSTAPEYVADGEVLSDCPDWEVLSVPGHSADSTAFYNPTTRTLCSGDAILTARGKAWFNPETVMPDAQAATEDRLRSLRVDVLLPGHGLAVTGTDLLATAVGFRDRP